jgi:hypothetical protein
MHTLNFIDSQTGGEPTRVVFVGFPDLGTGTLAERRNMFRTAFHAADNPPPVFPARLSTLGDIDLSSCHHQGSSA